MYVYDSMQIFIYYKIMYSTSRAGQAGGGSFQKKHL